MLMSNTFDLPVTGYTTRAKLTHGCAVSFIAIDDSCECDCSTDEHAQAAAHAINTHDPMAELLCKHRAFFEGIIEHASKGATIEQLEIYRAMVGEIDEVLNHG